MKNWLQQVSLFGKQPLRAFDQLDYSKPWYQSLLIILAFSVLGSLRDFNGLGSNSLFLAAWTLAFPLIYLVSAGVFHLFRDMMAPGTSFSKILAFQAWYQVPLFLLMALSKGAQLAMPDLTGHYFSLFILFFAIGYGLGGFYRVFRPSLGAYFAGAATLTGIYVVTMFVGALGFAILRPPAMDGSSNQTADYDADRAAFEQSIENASVQATDGTQDGRELLKSEDYSNE